MSYPTTHAGLLVGDAVYVTPAASYGTIIGFHGPQVRVRFWHRGTTGIFAVGELVLASGQ